MRATPILLTAFPLLLIGTMAAERLALLSLAAHLDSPALWNAWLTLYGTCGRVWQALDAIIGSEVSVQFLALLLVAVLVLCSARTRRWAQCSFLINHVALILVFAMFAVGDMASVSSLAMVPSPGHLAITWISQFSSIQIAMLAGGAASCLLCHAAFWLNVRERSAPVSLQIRVLQQNL